MNADDIIASGTPIACHPWPRRLLTPAAWTTLSASLANTTDPELLGLWADTAEVHAIWHDHGAFALCSVPVSAGTYAALSPHRPAAAWFERMIFDLWGHRAEGGTDARPWLDHGRWGIASPLSPRPPPRPGAPEPMEFLPVEADDFHQIPVGPVHAGIIEPGHFRFSAQGETVIRLELRLGWLHKGTLGLMRGKSPRAAARFAARLSGDSTVAHGIAFARAAEAACNVAPPPAAIVLRGVMGELERLANHLGDCGTVTGDTAFAWLPARFGRHRETILAACATAFGHRLMMDAVIPGGVATGLAPGGAEDLLDALSTVETELPALLSAYENHASLIDRVVGTGIVAPALAARFAPGGFVGRASGRDFDVRRQPGYPPYTALDVSTPILQAGPTLQAGPILQAGDVDARVRIRLAEITRSIALVRTLLTNLPDGPLSLQLPMASGEGLGWAEGFRGDAWCWLRLDGGLIGAVFLRDPSWLQWPLIETAILGNIVADFPLINASFNCSYSGVDL